MAANNEERRFVKLFVSNSSSKSFMIPLEFNEYLPDPLPNTVELVNSGTRSWTIRMKRRGEKVYLTLGWENFVKENNLEDGKWLNFIYDCNSTFRVVIFGHNGCSEHRDFPQVVMDVDDYVTGEEEEDEEQDINN